MPAEAGIQVRDESVVPLENGIQVMRGLGWTPVFTGVTIKSE
jgi:hypothetical protein